MSSLGPGNPGAGRKQPRNGVGEIGHLSPEHLAKPAKMMLRPATAQILCHGELSQRVRVNRARELELANPIGVTPGGNPPDPVTGCERLRERRAENDVARCVE